ncbi:chemotaxis protein CheA [bacterium]|nr:chemotaxis protein CheA [bacterium]
MEEKSKKLTQKEIEESGIATFREEAVERLSELEEIMLELEDNPENPELIGAAFRALHTIKGSGGMFGFTEIESFTHAIENVYDQVRDGGIPVTAELIALTLAAHDQIRKMLDPAEQSVEEIQKREEISASFRNMLAKKGPEANPVKKETNPGKNLPSEPLTFRIRFKPAADIFTFGTNPLLLLEELRELGDCFAVGHTDDMPPLEEMDPEQCYTAWDIILTTDRGLNAIQDVFIFVEDSSVLSIKVVESDDEFEQETTGRKLGEILVDRGDIKQEVLKQFLDKYEKIGQKMEKEGLVAPDKIQSALAEQKHVRSLKDSRKKSDTIQNLRVPSDKLDKLVDLVGELVTGQARLSQLAQDKNDPSLVSVAEEIERLTAELRDNTMSVRMLNFGTTFNKFKRLIRDLSRELGTEADLTTAGGDTELDKTVIDQLNDPLIHILRNSMDHGIEFPEDRQAAGKPQKGTIHLSAEYSGAHVLIKVRDDGAGLDSETIRNKAVERGLIASDSKQTEREIFALVFEPGFSTAKAVTNVSGRGVGMDVVKKTIESMRGSVEIESKKGKGSTITIKLPLTLAIIDGLLVEVGGDYFVIPLAAVEECVELSKQDVARHHGRHITRVRGQIVPYIRLRDQFEINGNKPDIEQIVITEIDKHRIGFVVDHVIGQHQTVIKNLNKIYKNVETISGATIMADGNVALIIDISRHLHLVEKACEGQNLTDI